MKWKHYQEGGEVAPVPANTWAPEWSRVPPPAYTATPAAVPTDPSARFPAGGAANPAIAAYLGGTNPATISYDPAIQEQLRGYRQGLKEAGVAGVASQVAEANRGASGQSYAGLTPTQQRIANNRAYLDSVIAEGDGTIAGVPIVLDASLSDEDYARGFTENYNAALAHSNENPTGQTTGVPLYEQGFSMANIDPVAALLNNTLVGSAYEHFVGEPLLEGNTIDSLLPPTGTPADPYEGGSDNDRESFVDRIHKQKTSTKNTDSYAGGRDYDGWGENDGGLIDPYNNPPNVKMPEGYNTGGMASWWENDPLANLAKTEVGDGSTVAKELGQAFAGGLAAPQQGTSPTASIKGKAMDIGTNLLFGSLGIPGFNRGGWVAARAKHLNVGGMAAEQAGMQAYQDMMSLAGPGGSPESMMPEGAPAPEGFAIDHGYKPPGMSTKEQMEVDKMMAQRDAHAGDQMRKEKSFDKAEARKDDMHRMAMQQKQEGHQESMKQKRSGPLG